MSQTHTLLTADEAAEILSLTRRQVSLLASRGELPSVRLPGSEVRYDPADLWTWVDAHRHPAREVSPV